MANLFKIILCRSGHRGQSGGGIFMLPLRSIKSFSVVPNLGNSLLKSHIKQSTIILARHYPIHLHKKDEVWRKPSKFSNLYLQIKPKLNEDKLVNYFRKMYNIYMENENARGFEKDFKEFTESADFKTFCTELDNNLPKLSPTSLLLLSDLDNLPVEETKKLMNKIDVLILDNFNQFTVFEKFHLFAKYSKSDKPKDKNIKKACEVYFLECFENELYYEKFSRDMFQIIESEIIPKQVRRALLKKGCDEVFLNKLLSSEIVHFFRLCCDNPDLLSKQVFLRALKKFLHALNSNNSIERMSSLYKNLLNADDSFYDEEVITILTDLIYKKLHSTFSKAAVMRNLCLMGHYQQEFVNFITDLTLSVPPSAVNMKKGGGLAEVLARCSFFETRSEADVQKIRELFELYQFSLSIPEFPAMVTWCEFLTYLGCDTRLLHSEIFNALRLRANLASEKNALLLYHLAKASPSGDYEVPEKEVLDKLLAIELKKISSLPLDCLGPYFKDNSYVLSCCTTSDHHPLHFVSLFGANNQPVDLSKYREEQQKLPTNSFFNVGEIKIPHGSKLVVFHVFPDYQPIKFRNEPRMSGIAKMHLKAFENLDCSVVLLPPKFFKFNPEEKEKFLRSQIDEVLGSSKDSNSSKSAAPKE